MIPYLEEIARQQLGSDSDEFLQIIAMAQSFPGAMVSMPPPLLAIGWEAGWERRPAFWE